MGKIKRRLEKQAAREQTHLPRLNPPVQNWNGDLPDRSEDTDAAPQLIRVNELNDVWMEIPRYVNFGWGSMWPVSLLLSVIPIFFLIFMLQPGIISYIPALFIFSIGIAISASFFIYNLKSVLFAPRGAPIRFNRKRQKVYVYEFKKSIWPWKRWHAVIKVFDWKDIHGEWVMMRGHADWGHRIYCAVCNPGTFDVVDRFILTWTVGSVFDAAGLWSFCLHYMEAKPVPTKPLRRDRPRDWTPFKTVQWPEGVERESTTAPEGPANSG